MLQIAHESLLTNRQVNSLILVTSIKNHNQSTKVFFGLKIFKNNHFSKNSISAITDTLTDLPSPCDAFSYPSMRLLFNIYFDCVSKFQKVIDSFKVLENICWKMDHWSWIKTDKESYLVYSLSFRIH